MNLWTRWITLPRLFHESRQTAEHLNQLDLQLKDFDQDVTAQMLKDSISLASRRIQLVEEKALAEVRLKELQRKIYTLGRRM